MWDKWLALKFLGNKYRYTGIDIVVILLKIFHKNYLIFNIVFIIELYTCVYNQIDTKQNKEKIVF